MIGTELQLFSDTMERDGQQVKAEVLSCNCKPHNISNAFLVFTTDHEPGWFHFQCQSCGQTYSRRENG